MDKIDNNSDSIFFWVWLNFLVFIVTQWDHTDFCKVVRTKLICWLQNRSY